MTETSPYQPNPTKPISGRLKKRGSSARRSSRGRAIHWVVFFGLSVTILLIVLGIGFLLLVPLTNYLAGDALAITNPKDKSDAVDAIRKTLLQGIAGLLAVGALIFTGRTYLLARQGQVTDRYTKAVDQLGQDTVTQRTGGVFALERIMRESKNDHWAIVEVLSAFIRSNRTKEGGSHGTRPARDDNGGASSDRKVPNPLDDDISAAGFTNAHEQMADILKPAGPDPTLPDSDVKAALVVIGRRPRRPNEERDWVRLQRADLRSTLMRDGVLDGAALRSARLDEIHWEHASLRDVRFRGSKMLKADLVSADLTRAGLQQVDLRGAKLDNALLTDAQLEGAHLAGAVGAVLTDAQLAEVHCKPGAVECPGKNTNARTQG